MPSRMSTIVVMALLEQYCERQGIHSEWQIGYVNCCIFHLITQCTRGWRSRAVARRALQVSTFLFTKNMNVSIKFVKSMCVWVDHPTPASSLDRHASEVLHQASLHFCGG